MICHRQGRLGAEPAKPKRAPRRLYKVYVDDNYHYLDESERTLLGRYATLEEAIAACKALVDEFLAENYRPGMTARELLVDYMGNGGDPWIAGKKSDGDDVPFSAWDYAKGRCEELCAAKPDGSSTGDTTN